MQLFFRVFRALFFVGLLSSLALGIAQAATLYVASTGSDSTGNGSMGNPWRNIQFAINHASFTPGSDIVAQDGDYSPFFVDKSGSTAALRYTIRAAGSNARVLGEVTYDGRPAAIHVARSYVTIDGFIVDVGKTVGDSFGVRSRGIRVSGLPTAHVFDVRILNNKVSNAGWVGISTSYAENILIEGNTISNSKGQHGLYVANSADGPIIRRNISHHNAWAGIQINSDPATTVSDPPADGIIRNALVEQNIVYSNGIGGTDGAGGGSFDFASIRNARIINNLSYDNQRQGIVAWDDGFSDAFGSKDNLFANNTVVMPAGAGHAFSMRHGSTGNTLRNNILIHLDPSNNDSIAIDATSFAGGFTSDYNIVTKIEDTGGNLVTLANWRTQSGQDTHSSVQTTSIFNNFAMRDFTLAAGSTAIDAGVLVAQVTNDLLGTARPQGAAYDIGAYEKISAITAPGAPTMVSAVAGIGQATVSFTAPASNGGSAITGYTATCGTKSAGGTVSPIIVTMLSPGVAVTCTVVAMNMIGTGPASAPSNSVTPPTVPGAPTAVSAVAGMAQATVNFTAPASNGGSAITGYTATCGAQSAGGTVSPIVVAGLTPGATVTCTVVAMNAVGTGPASAPSNSVTPPSVPGAPVFNSGIVGDGQITALFSPPTSDGGSPITAYTVQCASSPLPTRFNTGSGSPITVGNMSNGATYTCGVIAGNAIGGGPVSNLLMLTPSASAPLAFIGAVSRKSHGLAGSYELPIDISVGIGGAVSVEPRSSGAGHTLVFQFNVPLMPVNPTVSAVDAAAAPIGSASVTAVSGKEVVVAFSGVPDNRRATVTLTGVNGLANSFPVSLGFLVGDATNSRRVNAGDISALKANLNKAVNSPSLAKYDLNADGSITSADVSAAKARSGISIP